MKIGIVGGALQGMEAVLLSRKAGYRTVVLDRRVSAPACYLADSSCTVDIALNPEDALKSLSDCDAVIPACEDLQALNALENLRSRLDIPLLFDPVAYRKSSSKAESNKIMAEAGVPLPKSWPECGFPAIVKPSCQSGSIGVSEVDNEKSMEIALQNVTELNDTPIVQEFVHGKSVSIEVIGSHGHCRAYATTEVVLSNNYDCKRVICGPNILPPDADKEFLDIGKKIGDTLHLNAIMDVEAIYASEGLKVLEIDARLPSQTPLAVEAATGINLLQEMISPSNAVPSKSWSSYEHYVVEGNKMHSSGEKEFSHVDRPHFVKGLFGSDEAVTDYIPGRKNWRITVINHGATAKEIEDKRRNLLMTLKEDCGITEFIDESPRVV